MCDNKSINKRKGRNILCHIGTARTALFNYLFAKKNNGKFILRIEDTDAERTSQAYVDNIFDSLKALGLNWDEGPDVGGEYGPYTQSQRFDIYPKYIQKLLDEGFAYECFCTPEELEAEKEEAWEFVVKMMCIIKDLYNGNKNLPEGCEEEQLGHNAIAGGFQGQRQWTDFYPNCDFPEAMMNSSFDWNGAREPYVLATENDTLNGVGMLFGNLLTNTAQIFADVRTYWSPEAVKQATGYELEGVAKESKGFIHLINSGAACIDACGEAKDENGNGVIKPFWEMTEKDQKACLEATEWCPADNGYFRGGGFSSRFLTNSEMPVTMVRLNLVKGLGPVLQIAEGWTVKLPDEVSDKLWKRTDYTWPCTWFAPRLTGEGAFKSAYDVMNNWGANHGAISYGHIGADLITLCSMLRIPVCMHNVPEDKIFRPAAWNAFGMDKEGQDYRACKNYGPLYK